MSGIHVVACHFNPAQYELPKKNLIRFVDETLRYHRYTLVELALDDDKFVLSPSKNHIQLRGTREKNCLWQKEALLNIAIEDVLKRYNPPKAIAWIDADLLFLREDWATAALVELVHAPVVQLFSECVRLDDFGHLDSPIKSTGWWWSTHNRQWIDFNYSHPGYAWAARRELFEAGHRLYDKIITGCGDTLMLRSWTGQNLPVPFKDVGPRVATDVIEWANKIGPVEMSFVIGTIVHMYHGKMKDRANKERRFILQEFDPKEHVQLNSDGLLEWTSTATETLKSEIISYFKARKEDN